MNKLFKNHPNMTTAGISIGYLALVFAVLTLIISLSSCASVHSQEHSGCFASKRFVGYGPGGYSYRTKPAKR